MARSRASPSIRPSATDSIDWPNREPHWHPDSFVFRASDGFASADATVRLTIGPVNAPPVFGALSDRSVNEGATLAFPLAATDTEGDTLTFSSAGLPSGATLNAATGEFSWTPSFTQAGTYPVTFVVRDPSGGTDSRTIHIVVVDVPQTGNHDPDCSLRSSFQCVPWSSL